MKERLLFPYTNTIEVQQYFETLHEIFSHIVDEKSKQIFQYRLLMTFAGDISYVRKLVLTTEVGRTLHNFLEKQNKIYVYGAGIRGQRIVQMFPEMNWESYIDREKDGICNNLEIVKLEKFALKEDSIILITNLEGYDEIKYDLIEYGISRDLIYTLNDFEVEAHQEQYFEERCVKNFSDTQGAFLDAGSFDGTDCIKFVGSRLYDNNPLYAFEPDEKNYNNCKKNLERFHDAQVLNAGLSNVIQQARFLSDRGEFSRITDQGDCLINMDTIDSVMGQKAIGFIKMDIEGNEQDAIRGAKLHIIRDKPNLMISVYHKVDDIIEIPKLLLEMNPDYRFALGHYSICNGDTVLYAF